MSTTAIPSPSAPRTAASAQRSEARTNQPRLWTVLAVIPAAFASIYLMQGLVYIAIAGYFYASGAITEWDRAQIDEQCMAAFDGKPIAYLIGHLPNAIGIVAIALLAARLSPEPVRTRLGLVRPAMPKHGWLATVFAALPAKLLGAALAAILTAAVTYAFGSSAVESDPGSSSQEQASITYALLILLQTSVLAGLSEELLFRGFIQRRLLQRWSPVAAIGLTSLAFAAMHLDLKGFPQHLVTGIFLGIVAYRTGSIWPSVVIHAIGNAFALAIPLAAASASGATQVALMLGALGVLGIGLVLGLPSAAWLLFGKIPVAGPGVRRMGAVESQPVPRINSESGLNRTQAAESVASLSA